MRIHKLPLGQLQANCYFIIKENLCLIVDPSDEAHFILEQIQRLKLKPIGMLATHGHFDHLMAVGEIQATYDIPLFINENDLFLVKRLKETARHFLNHDPFILEPKNIKYFKKGKMEIDDFSFEVIDTPGHTPGSVCFYFKKDKVIFTGDTLFKQGIGRYDFSYSSKIDLKNSLNKLFKLSEDTIVYSGHGEETTIGDEKNILQSF